MYKLYVDRGYTSNVGSGEYGLAFSEKLQNRGVEKINF